MGYLPQVSGREIVRALGKLGYFFDVEHGSHIILRNSSPPYRRITIPDHKTVAKGTLRSILREVGITVEEFKKLL
jgi:predicted RNA binding protein YcfA (HicA-like mRNA interferase family)